MRGLEELMKVSRDPRFETSDRYRFTSELENTICHAADRVFVITHALKQLMIERGIPAEKLVVRSEEHTSELQSLMRISYAVFCLKKKMQSNETQASIPIS